MRRRRMRYLLDTTLLIDHANGRPGALAVVRTLFSEPNDLFVCDTVVTEATSGVDDVEVGAIIALIDAVEYVSTHPDAARWAGASRRRLRRTSPRQLGDAMIAGVAWFNDAVVVTRNPRDFEVQGVRVLGYE
jgi:Predicted nucleic acid-binding protein, contains PIN domain